MDKRGKIEYDDMIWRDYGDGHYLCTRAIKNRLLHRYIWTKYNGEIPENYVIHHIDFNSYNNNINNLICITQIEHKKLHKKSKETRIKIGLSGCKSVVRSDGIIFNSLKEAADKSDINNTASISQVLSGKHKTAGGYGWHLSTV